MLGAVSSDSSRNIIDFPILPAPIFNSVTVNIAIAVNLYWIANATNIQGGIELDTHHRFSHGRMQAISFVLSQQFFCSSRAVCSASRRYVYCCLRERSICSCSPIVLLVGDPVEPAKSLRTGFANIV